LIQYCLRELGAPVIQIEVSEDQCDDRCDEALSMYTERHVDGSEETWTYYELTAEDVANGYIKAPVGVLEVLQVMPVHSLLAHTGLFDPRYQIALQALQPWQSFDSLEYFMRITHFETTIDMTTVTPTFEYVKHSRKLTIHRNFK